TGHFQMYSLAWVGLKTPDIFRQAFHSNSVPPRGVNRGRYADPTTDRLIAEAENTPERIQQQALYRELQTRLLDTLPYVPLWYEDHFVLKTKEIEGYTLHTDGNYDGLLHVQWASASRTRSHVARQATP
ncbi:MAG: ABC transporter substrate-binding protein, partial [Nitrospirota bacterium]|nr:ABC transporter substrate-binding protein [Nitrospirota bacterium]